jgi:DNA polymerase elongation subunit (family B)
MRFYTNVQLSGNNICVREVDENGNRKKYRVPFCPKLYTPTNKPAKFWTLSGQGLEELSYESIKDAKEFTKRYEDVQGFEVFGNTMYQYAWITESFPTALEADMQKMSIISLDIEVNSTNGFPEPTEAKEKVLSFVIKHWASGQRYVCAVNPDRMGVPYDPTTRGIPGKINYLECKDEEELLDAFIHIWKKLQPDIITGWAIKTFDIPYLVNRLLVLRGEGAANFLSPWGYIQKKSVTWLNQEVPTYEISGVSNLDYMFIYKKNTFVPRENWKLDYIATVELGEGKVAYEGPIQAFYEQDFHKFVDYNIQDVDLIDKLDDKLKLVSVVMDVAYYAKVNYEDVLSQTRVWDMKINNRLLEKNVVIPQSKHNVKGEKYEGAYVKAPIPGLYKWIVSVDFASLYPNLIRTFNIGMETKHDYISGINQHTMLTEESYIVNAMKDSISNDLCLAANGVRYTRSELSLYSELLAEVFGNRIAFKKRAKVAKSKIEALKSKEQTPDVLREIDSLGFEVSYCTVKDKVMKVLMNSLYGAIGCEYFRHYDVQNAEAVTISGQYVLKYVENATNVHLNKSFKTKNVDYVVYCDTDSMYINLESLVINLGLENKPVEKVINFLDAFCKKELQPFIDQTCLDVIQNKVNGVGDNLKMVRDVIADVAIWTAKKRYIMNVYDSEGVRYDQPQMKMMGIEAIKSSTPGPCRKKLEEAIKIIISGDKKQLVDLVQDFRREFKTLELKTIALPTGVNGIEDYPMTNGQFKSKTPWHVKASLTHNVMVEKHGLKTKPIASGEKIKVIFLKTPNPAGSPSIAFVGTLPKEFQIDAFIDYDTQFGKSFLEPLKLITEAINWNVENSRSLEDFF